MDAKVIIEHLDRDFILPQCSDNWSEMKFNTFYYSHFTKTYMGLVLDHAETINHVYTSVFASDDVVKYFLKENITDCLWFTHHPMNWDVTQFPAFRQLSDESLFELKKRRISLYSLHVPLDRNSDFSTSVNLAHAMNAKVIGEFYEYFGCSVAVIAKTSIQSINQLKKEFEKVINHEAKLYKYGSDDISNGLVAFCGGGGNQPELYEYLASKGVNTYITGITTKESGYQPAIDAHENAKTYGINLIGGTHYSTEKFACMTMCEYFNDLGVPSTFIPETPCYSDM